MNVWAFPTKFSLRLLKLSLVLVAFFPFILNYQWHTLFMSILSFGFGFQLNAIFFILLLLILYLTLSHACCFCFVFNLIFVVDLSFRFPGVFHSRIVYLCDRRGCLLAFMKIFFVFTHTYKHSVRIKNDVRMVFHIKYD